MTTFAKEIMKYAHWEPGMVPMSIMGPSQRLRRRDAPLHCTAAHLDDRQTVDILFGQLRERFAAVGWTGWWQHTWRAHDGARCDHVQAGAFSAKRWDKLGLTADVLLAGFRKVAELESDRNGHTS